MIQTQTFTYGKATVTVRRATVRDRLRVDTLTWKLPDAETTDERHAQRSFARLVVQTEKVDGDLGFPLPKFDAPDAELRAGYEALMDAPGALWDAWVVALARVDDAIAEPEVAPNSPKGEKIES
jgi:hypothetical protein